MLRSGNRSLAGVGGAVDGCQSVLPWRLMGKRAAASPLADLLPRKTHKAESPMILGGGLAAAPTESQPFGVN